MHGGLAKQWRSLTHCCMLSRSSFVDAMSAPSCRLSSSAAHAPLRHRSAVGTRMSMLAVSAVICPATCMQYCAPMVARRDHSCRASPQLLRATFASITSQRLRIDTWAQTEQWQLGHWHGDPQDIAPCTPFPVGCCKELQSGGGLAVVKRSVTA